jgi:hypothetical protein
MQQAILFSTPARLSMKAFSRQLERQIGAAEAGAMGEFDAQSLF